MKITASRKDDILKQREEYDKETKVVDDRYEKGKDDWEKALYKSAKDIETNLSELIGSTTIDLRIEVSPWGRYRDGYEVTVEGNNRDIFDKKKALSWHWNAYLKDGEVAKESGSWSGLQATTAEQLDDLQESVRILKKLNEIDWAPIINAPKPELSKYVTEEDRQFLKERSANRPKFENELIAASLEDLVGSKDTALKLTKDTYFRHPVMLVTGLTDKFVRGYIFDEGLLDRVTENVADYVLQHSDERRTSRDNISLKGKEELNTIDLA